MFMALEHSEDGASAIGVSWALENRSTCGLAAMTSASHAEGRQLDPGQVYIIPGCHSRAFRMQDKDNHSALASLMRSRLPPVCCVFFFHWVCHPPGKDSRQTSKHLTLPPLHPITSQPPLNNEAQTYTMKSWSALVPGRTRVKKRTPTKPCQTT